MRSAFVSRSPIFRIALTIASFGLFTGCSGGTPEQDFWVWFENSQETLFNFQKDQERIFDPLGTQLHIVNPNLTFEFAPIEDGRREFTISADGIKAAFPAVESLYAAAPPLPRWKILKFRQRREPTDISFKGVRASARSVLVVVDPGVEKSNLTVFVPGYSVAQRNTYMSIVFLMLDQALGEFDVETRVGKIEVADASQATEKAGGLDTLPATFDALYRVH